MQSLYRTGDVNAPVHLTRPSKLFKKKVLFAAAALLFFVLVYSGLMIWFGYEGLLLIRAAYQGNLDNPLFGFILGALLSTLSFFMAKSLFNFNKRDKSDDFEITEQDEPILFDYIYQLADELGAPRPHKVYLSPMVNASVFYDLSLINLIWPSKKNLVIGLGLVNSTNLGEFKAILAHEFGHFAQQSMMLGRYVYTAQQVAARVVGHRDLFDRFLAGLSSIDLRVAWIGWILSILVWGIRSLVESIFLIVAVAERALSREMEFQADLVSVSISGSDALIHGLYRLGPADEGFHAAIATVEKLLADKKAVQDLYSLQEHHILSLRKIYGDPNYGLSPKSIDPTGKERIFKSHMVNPPEMWATHPNDIDREENAKRHYLPAEIDNRSAWELFQNPKQRREQLTAHLLKEHAKETTSISDDEAIQEMNRLNYDWGFLNEKYNGVFLHRYSTLLFESVEDMLQMDEVYQQKDHIDKLYSVEFKQVVQDHEELMEEMKALIGVQHEVITAEKREIYHQGQKIKRKDIPKILERLEKRKATIEVQIKKYDQNCRSQTYFAGTKVSTDLALEMRKTLRLLHFAEHTLTDFQDASNKYENKLAVVLADGRVTQKEANELIIDCNDLERVMSAAYHQCLQLKLPAPLLERIGIKGMHDLLGEYKFSSAFPEALSEWVEAVGSWAIPLSDALSLLRNASLERLLYLEDKAVEAYKDEIALQYESIHVPNVENYPVFGPQRKRKLTLKLGLWDRFMAGDGLVPSALKFLVSALLVGSASYASNLVEFQYQDIYIHNAFNQEFTVKLLGEELTISANSTVKYQLLPESDLNIQTFDKKGTLIEKVDYDFVSTSYVYNIANGGVIFRDPVVYGNSRYQNLEEEVLGAGRIIPVRGDYFFEDPPTSVEIRNRSNFTVQWLINILEAPPAYLYALIEDHNQREAFLESHLKLSADDLDRTQFLELARDSMPHVFEKVDKSLNHIAYQRILFDNASKEAKDSLKGLYAEALEKDPSNPDLKYLNIRCMEKSGEHREKALQLFEEYPEKHWAQVGGVYTLWQIGDYQKLKPAIQRLINYSKNTRQVYDLDFERICRYVSERRTDFPENDRPLTPVVDLMRWIENGRFSEDSSPFYRALYFIGNGQPEDAISVKQQEELEELRLQALYSTSLGAKNTFLDKMLALDLETFKELPELFALAGLRAKHGSDLETFYPLASQVIGSELSSEKLKSFVKMVRANRYDEAAQAINNMHQVHQLYLKMMAQVWKGDKVPNKWKKEVYFMLFNSEKPFLGQWNEAS